MNNELFEYEINNDSVTITKYIGSQADVDIPSEIDGYPVTKIGNSAFRGNRFLNSVNLPKSVIELGEDVFSDCSSLKDVVFGNDDIIINRGAFDFCINLQLPVSTPQLDKYLREYGMAFHTADLLFQDANDNSTSSEDSNTLFARANSFYNGSGVAQDFEEAYRLYLKAAQRGHVEAMNSLGSCYESGKGTGQDCFEAAKWYRKAAERGYAPAQRNMGFCYFNGRGVEKNYDSAYNWFNKAAQQGDRISKAFLPLLAPLKKESSILNFNFKSDRIDYKAIDHIVEQGLNNGYVYQSSGLDYYSFNRSESFIHCVSWILLSLGGLGLLGAAQSIVQFITVLIMITVGLTGIIYIHRLIGASRISMDKSGFFSSKLRDTIPWNTIGSFYHHMLSVNVNGIYSGSRLDLTIKLKRKSRNKTSKIKIFLYFRDKEQAISCVNIFREYLKQYQSSSPDQESDNCTVDLKSLRQDSRSGQKTTELFKHIY